MMKRIRIGMVLALAAFLAGCQGPCDKITSITAPTGGNGSLDVTTFVAAGTSISAGWQSGGLVDRHQTHSFPAIFAQAIGKSVLTNGQGSFTFPAVNHDGIPALTRIQSLSPLIISSAGQTQGAPANFSQNFAYNNMGIPGALAVDFVDSTNYHATVGPPAGIGRSDFTMFNLIQRGRGTIAQQVVSLDPTLISFEYGSNEVLGSATAGTTALLFPSATYAALLTGSMNFIHTFAPTAKLALWNVPNVTSIPFCTTFKPYTVSLSTGLPVALKGPGNADLAAGDLVLLTAGPLLAAGDGIPVGAYNYVNPLAPGTGNPLPGAVVLSVSEQSAIATTISNMNAAIDSVATRPWIAKVDLNGLLADAAVNGIQVGATHYTSAFVTGGLFTLDGVHPSDVAHAVAANALIDALNARFGASLQHVNVASYATNTASSAHPVTRDDGLTEPMLVNNLQDGFRMLFPWKQ